MSAKPVTSTFESDYLERVYAGVLGKTIGVYLGRPIEGWDFRKILNEPGEINYYVNERRQAPLIVSDDDLSGTFTFLRALEDYGNSPDLTAEQIGQTWLNYIIENRTILWWGGMGMSTEHTAFLRLKHGMRAPQSGSIATNGKVVAEQIGSQIFIDGWAMVAPGNPDLAVKLATRAASVSHDGEAIYGAVIIAAMEALAFVENDLNVILDRAVTYIPKDCVIAKMIFDLRAFHARENSDWRKCFEEVMEKSYGYDKFGGNCHMVPNHGIIILALLYAGDHFQRGLMIANTCGWDTDCNSGNVGCFLGIKNKLAGIDAGPDYRGPVADRLLLPTADGGACMTDTLIQAYRIANMGRAMAGQKPVSPKGGARFHFSQPGSVQGFVADESNLAYSVTTSITNVLAKTPSGDRALAIAVNNLDSGKFARVGTTTFPDAKTLAMAGYAMCACPTVYPGQTIRATVQLQDGSSANLSAKLFLRQVGFKDRFELLASEPTSLKAGTWQTMEWKVPVGSALPIFELGIERTSSGPVPSATVLVDWIAIVGEPNYTTPTPANAGSDYYKKTWVDGVDNFQPWGVTAPGQAWVLIKNEGRGLIIQGAREWKDIHISSDVWPHLAKAAGVAVRVQGMVRYYALLLTPAEARLVKALDGETVLAKKTQKLEFGRKYSLQLEAKGNQIKAWVDGALLFEVTDSTNPLTGGAMAQVIEEGRCAFSAVTVRPS